VSDSLNDFETALLRYLTTEQLQKIRSVRVGIAGAGGLGSNCATALVRSGFREIKVVDFDVIEPSNLNRQFYFLDQVGKPKVQVLQENLQRINPSANIVPLQLRIDSTTVEDLFLDCDIVVEAFDKPESKRMIVESYMNSGKLLVSASGLAGWGNSDRIAVHRIRDNFFIIGDLTTGIESGAPPLSPCVSIAAAKQADIILNYVLESSRIGG